MQGRLRLLTVSSCSSSSSCCPGSAVLARILLILVLLFGPGLGFILEGSDSSFVKFKSWSGESNLILEFNTIQPSGLILYTDDGLGNDYFELKLVEGSLRLRYNLDKDGQSLLITLGGHLNDGLWHRVEIKRNGPETSLTLDGFITQSKISTGRDFAFGTVGLGYNVTGGHVYIGGLPTSFNNKISELSLPSVVFEPRFRGAIRNLIYSNQDQRNNKPQDILESKGLVIGGGEACERHDPCQHSGQCISTDNGPICDCKHTEFQGSFCEKAKDTAEGTFTGNEYIEYDMRSGGVGGGGSEAILSTLDEISFVFKTTNSYGLLFYSGDGIDYFSISMREGRLYLSINIGSGPLDTKIHPDRFNDNHWHSIRVTRKIQEITSNIDGIYFERWTLAGAFTILSSNHVTIGGYNTLQPLIIGIYDQPSNFIGCLRKVEYRADTLRLELLELARSRHRLITLHGNIAFKCYQQTGAANSNWQLNLPNKHSMNSGTVTFTTPESYLVVSTWNASLHTSLSGGGMSGSTSDTFAFKIKTTEANGLLLYAFNDQAPLMVPRGYHTKHIEEYYIGIEMIDGLIYLNINLGNGHLRVQGGSSDNLLNDGEWHKVVLIRNGRSGSFTVDDLITQFNTKGIPKQLFFNKIFVGGFKQYLLTPLHSYPSTLWTMNLNLGFVGCLNGLIINEAEIDIITLMQQQDIGSIRPLCHQDSSEGNYCESNPCLNNGKCLSKWSGFSCDCTHTDYMGHTCHKSAPMASFDGTQYIQIKTDAVPLKQEAQDVVIRFRTNRPTGLLVYMDSSSSSQEHDEQGTSDFFKLSLEFTRIKLVVRTGDREKSLVAGSDLNDNQWHLVRVARRGNHIRIQIDDSPVVHGEVLTRDWELSIRNILIGGINNHNLNILSYVGHLEQLYINNLNVFDLLQTNQLNSTIITAKFNKIKHVIHNPITIKNTHIGLQQLRGYSSVRIYFQFRTKYLNGVILYNGGNYNDYIAVYVSNGVLTYSYDLGNGVVTLANTHRILNDNKWHSVSIVRNVGTNQLIIDDVATSCWTDGNSTSSSAYLDLNGLLYIGGVPENMYNTLPIDTRTGFIGCLASLELNSEAINLFTDALLPSKLLIKGCEDLNEKCAATSCANGGICLEQWSGISCNCDSTSYTGPTCEKDSVSFEFGPGDGIVLYSFPPNGRPDTKADVIIFGFQTYDTEGVLVRIDSSLPNDDYIQIDIRGGRVSVEYNLGTKDLGMHSQFFINDNKYHVLKFTRNGPNASLQIDNLNITTQHFYGNQMGVFNSQGSIQVGGRWRSEQRLIERSYQGVMSGLVVNEKRVLDFAHARIGKKDGRKGSGRKGEENVRVIGDARPLNSRKGTNEMDNEIKEMQKTPASSNPGPGIMDDLVSSGGCNQDDEDECTPVFDTGSSGTGDDLITPVYIQTPSTTSRRPTSTTTWTSSTKQSAYVPCDDEDCFPGGGSGDSALIPDTHTRYPPVSTYDANGFTEETTWTTTFGLPGPHYPFTTDKEEDEVTTDPRPPPPPQPPAKPATAPPQQPPPPPTSTISEVATIPTTTTTRFIPPTTPKTQLYPVGSYFDENFGLQPKSTLQPKANDPRNSFVAETSDSTLIIIIIIALLMIIIVSILIIFFMCKRRDDPIYKIDNRYESFVPPTNPVHHAAGQGQPGRGQHGGSGGGGGAHGGNRKQGVKEWYV